MEVVSCQHQLKLQEKIYGIWLIELVSEVMDEQKYMRDVSNWLRRFNHKEEAYLVWTFNRQILRFKVKDIYYIYSYQRKTEVYTRKGVFRIRTTLTIEEENLGNRGFIRVHQGYLVREEVMQFIEGGDLILENDTHIPIGNKYKKNVKNMMEKYR